jgi:hypothetical protein
VGGLTVIFGLEFWPMTHPASFLKSRTASAFPGNASSLRALLLLLLLWAGASAVCAEGVTFGQTAAQGELEWTSTGALLRDAVTSRLWLASRASFPSHKAVLRGKLLALGRFLKVVAEQAAGSLGSQGGSPSRLAGLIAMLTDTLSLPGWSSFPSKNGVTSEQLRSRVSSCRSAT